MRHRFVIASRRRREPGAACGAPSPADGALFRHAHAGRYFGGLWFKLFSERGPC